MSRRKEWEIRESLSELKAMMARYRGMAGAPRLRMLAAMKEEPSRTYDEIALLIDRSPHTLKRWWREYRDRGLESLLDLRGGERHPSDDDDMRELKRELIVGKLQDLAQVRTWVDRHERYHPSITPCGRALDERNGDHRAREIGNGGGKISSSDGVGRITGFLNTLPSSGTFPELLDAVRNAIHRLYNDVDRVMIGLNLDCNADELVDDESLEGDRLADVPCMVVAQFFRGKNGEENGEAIRSSRRRERPVDRLIDHLRRARFPVERYHPPHCFEYHLPSGAYLGAIVIWREARREAVSEATIEQIEEMRPFYTFLLSDLILRHRSIHTYDRGFTEALEQLITDNHLTIQESRIVVMQLLGRSYAETAALLNVSVNTVRYHLKSIYRKSGTRSLIMLFAKYFTPWTDADRVMR